MSDEQITVAHLRKVRIRIDPLEGDAFSGDVDRALTYQFIFGIGSRGLSPLEMELHGKALGEEILLPVPPEGLEALFGHLALPAFPVQQDKESARIRLTVERVAPAEEREVVQAMSETAACGCGCGGH